MRCIDVFKSLRRALLAAGCGLLLGATAHANVIISEVSSWSSSSSALEADWFELTNTGASAVDITGWRVDDGPSLFAASLALNGITSISAGESAIFLEAGDGDGDPTPAEYAAEFRSIWFGDAPPAGLQIGTYTGSGIGFSTSGDGVNIFDAGGTEIWGLDFGDADDSAPLQTFDNSAALRNVEINTLSVVGVKGAFLAANAEEVGSPGVFVPEPTSALLLVAAAGIVACFRRRAVGR